MVGDIPGWRGGSWGAVGREAECQKVSTGAYRRLAKPGIETYKEERHSSPDLKTCRSWTERERYDSAEYSSCRIVVEE